MNTLLVSILESFLGDERKHNEETGQIAFDCPACSAEKNLPDGDGKVNLEINYNKNIFALYITVHVYSNFKLGLIIQTRC